MILPNPGPNPMPQYFDKVCPILVSPICVTDTICDTNLVLLPPRNLPQQNEEAKIILNGLITDTYS